MLKVIPRVLELRRLFEPHWCLSGQQWALIVNETCEFRTSLVLSLRTHAHTCMHTHIHADKEPAQCTKPLISSFDFKVKWHLRLLKLTCLHLCFFFPFSLLFYSCLIWEPLFPSPSPLPLSFSNVRANFKLQTPANTLRGVHWESLFQTIIISPTNWQIPHTFDCITIKRLLQPMLWTNTYVVLRSCNIHPTPNLLALVKRLAKEYWENKHCTEQINILTQATLENNFLPLNKTYCHKNSYF